MSDEFNREWITKQAIDVCSQYDYGVLTLRGLHYQLVSRGMTNSLQHYKRVVAAMVKARRTGQVAYAQFSDHDREAIGMTMADPTSLASSVSEGKSQVRAWMEAYSKNRWENQPVYLELWIEKKALQGVFQAACGRHDVALCPCKGYPSLTFLHEASERFIEAEGRGQTSTIAYFGDHDPSGEDIPRSIANNFAEDFGVYVDMQVIALTERQCRQLNLPSAPVKAGDSRSANFTGLGQIELDAVRPETLQQWAEDAILSNFDEGLHAELVEQEDDERIEYQQELRDFVATL